MLKVCNICNCELNNSNTAKKDAVRFRAICRGCYKVKRNTTRIKKTEVETKVFNELVDKDIIKLEIKTEKIIPITEAKNDSSFFSGIYYLIKKIIALKDLGRRKNGIQSKYSSGNG